MLIDWFTVGAQVLNFLILVWLMKRFLYKPTLHAIDEREKRIAAELADAGAKKAAAQKERDTFRQKNEEFDQQRTALMSQAKDEVLAERQRLIGQAHEAANKLSAKRNETLKNDALNLNQAIIHRAQHEVFAIARKALMDLAEVSLEERIGEVFIARLREMDGPAKQRMAEAIRTAPVLVRSAFELPASLREAIEHSLNEILASEVQFRFETAPDLVSGVELSTNGQKVAWSIAEYLKSLERGIGELINQQSKPEEKEELLRLPEPIAGSSTGFEPSPVILEKASSL
ncbi:MAG: F0F1 ATP synthase subunit delta [Xanthomonadales bacterium]|nr:F0F1 ATP synthase subunit delta [Xanthomonadales bacterium]